MEGLINKALEFRIRTTFEQSVVVAQLEETFMRAFGTVSEGLGELFCRGPGCSSRISERLGESQGVGSRPDCPGSIAKVEGPGRAERAARGTHGHSVHCPFFNCLEDDRTVDHKSWSGECSSACLSISMTAQPRPLMAGPTDSGRSRPEKNGRKTFPEGVVDRLVWIRPDSLAHGD